MLKDETAGRPVKLNAEYGGGAFQHAQDQVRQETNAADYYRQSLGSSHWPRKSLVDHCRWCRSTDEGGITLPWPTIPHFLLWSYCSPRRQKGCCFSRGLHLTEGVAQPETGNVPVGYNNNCKQHLVETNPVVLINLSRFSVSQILTLKIVVSSWQMETMSAL